MPVSGRRFSRSPLASRLRRKIFAELLQLVAVTGLLGVLVVLGTIRREAVKSVAESDNITESRLPIFAEDSSVSDIAVNDKGAPEAIFLSSWYGKEQRVTAIGLTCRNWLRGTMEDVLLVAKIRFLWNGVKYLQSRPFFSNPSDAFSFVRTNAQQSYVDRVPVRAFSVGHEEIGGLSHKFDLNPSAFSIDDGKSIVTRSFGSISRCIGASSSKYGLPNQYADTQKTTYNSYDGSQKVSAVKRVFQWVVIVYLSLIMCGSVFIGAPVSLADGRDWRAVGYIVLFLVCFILLLWGLE